MADMQLRVPPSVRKWLLRGGAVLIVLYLCFGAYVWWAMHQTPETFGRVMAKMPGPVPFVIFPFETAWMRARAGKLNLGDRAPDFSLVRLDKSGQVQLSSFARQQRPVALIFGSYT